MPDGRESGEAVRGDPWGGKKLVQIVEFLRTWQPED